MPMFRALKQPRGAALALMAGIAPALALLNAPVAAQPVVQPLRPEASQRLNEALLRLASNPESVPALVSAGRASIELNNLDSAERFFARAQAVEPNNGDVLAGLALISLRREDPAGALDLFDQAQATGMNLAPFAADRGLAYDLVGDNSAAQQLYGVALSQGESDEVVRRLALSHAIEGDQAGAEAILLPLLQRRDLAAYRTRAFALAIAGREDEAVSIAETMLPDRLARRISPYLRYMPRLTRQQQAAAANLGSFPQASQIGRENPQLARRATRSVPPAQASGADARMIPDGPPLGTVAQASPPAGELPPLAPPPAAATAPPPARPTVTTPTPGPVDQPAPSQPVAEPGFSLAETIASQEAPAAAAPAAASSPVAVALPEEPPEEQRTSLAEAFAGFTLAEAVPPPAAAGAVDITAIEPAREAPKPPPPPPNPSRQWVQVATGGDVSAFRFDWRRLQRSADGLLEGKKAYRVRWNRTNRLVTGPFDSASAAQAFVTQLKEAGIDAFRFTSAEGEEVVALD